MNITTSIYCHISFDTTAIYPLPSITATQQLTQQRTAMQTSHSYCAMSFLEGHANFDDMYDLNIPTLMLHNLFFDCPMQCTSVDRYISVSLLGPWHTTQVLCPSYWFQGPYSWKIANICHTCDVENHLRQRLHMRYDLFMKRVANFETEIARALTFATSHFTFDIVYKKWAWMIF